MTQIKEKKHRLPSDLYVGYVRVAVTACIKNRLPVFVNSNVVDYFSDTLISEATDNNCDTLIYLFMPDHLHVILKGKTHDAEPLKAMNRFKQKTGFWFSKNDSKSGWQKNYYDHLIRNEEGVLKHIRYVLNNPVRRGIVADWFDYPYKGSTSLDLNKEIFQIINSQAEACAYQYDSGAS
ncbi:transposase [bacterium]|nr:transposase [bacterium]